MVRLQKQREKEPSNLEQEATICGETIQTSLGVFQSASDFQIHGGNISSIGGDSTSFTANGDVHVVINHHHSPSPTPSISVASTSSSSSSINARETDTFRDQHRTGIFSARDEATVQSIPAIQRNCDIYRSHLATKGRGFPLWIPGPSQSLPIQYQSKGISMGDVGVTTVSGGFFYLFNIFRPKNHPINPRVMPEGFKPLKPKQGFDTLPSERDLMDDGYLASPSNIRARRDRGTSSLIFESFECAGAILTLPVGAKTEDLTCLVRLRKYVAAHLESWYRYARLYLGMDIQNGDLKVVTGCDKTSAWGMACLEPSSSPHIHSVCTGDSSSSVSSAGASRAASGKDRRFYLEFGPADVNHQRQGGKYEWAYSGEVAEVRSGPSSTDVAQLRTKMARFHGEGGSVGDEVTENYDNQCLFLRTMNWMLPDEVWQGILVEEEQDSEGEDDDEEEDEDEDELDPNEDGTNADRRYGHTPFRNAKNPNQRGTPSPRATQHRGIDASHEGMGPSHTMPVLRTADAPNTCDMPSVFPSRLMSCADHPSIAITKHLMQIRSEKSTMAVSLDHDWMSVVTEDDGTLPSSEELLKRIIERHPVREEEGVIFFDSEHQQTIKSLAALGFSNEDEYLSDASENVFSSKEPELDRQDKGDLNGVNGTPDEHERTRNLCERVGGTKKALLIGINYVERSGTNTSDHRKVKARQKQSNDSDIRRFLEGLGYRRENIVVLTDNDEADEARPTRQNIILQMKTLVQDAHAGDQFFFHFSGHSVQETAGGIEEEDGENEFITASDGQAITDDELKAILVDPLPPDCSLVGIFDSCHSGSVLDLPHYQCNRTYLPWVNKGKKGLEARDGDRAAYVSKSKGLEGKESSVTRLSEDIRSSNRRLMEGMPPGLDQSISLDEDLPRSRPEPPPIAFDGGHEEATRITKGKSAKVRNHGERKPDVIFLSASKHNPMDSPGNTIAEHLLDILRDNVKHRLEKMIAHLSAVASQSSRPFLRHRDIMDPHPWIPFL